MINLVDLKYTKTEGLHGNSSFLGGKMIEKPKRPQKINNQDKKQPQTISELIRRYDLDNIKIYDYLDSLVDKINTEIQELKK